MQKKRKKKKKHIKDEDLMCILLAKAKDSLQPLCKAISICYFWSNNQYIDTIIDSLYSLYVGKLKAIVFVALFFFVQASVFPDYQTTRCSILSRKSQKSYMLVWKYTVWWNWILNWKGLWETLFKTQGFSAVQALAVLWRIGVFKVAIEFQKLLFRQYPLTFCVIKDIS